MGEPQRRRRRCRRGSGEDRISGLPDALMHEILVRLRSAAAAARTSVLSRRWRHLWAHMPELLLVAPPEAKAEAESFPGTVDAALDGYLAPTLERLGVSHCTGQLYRDLRIPGGRIAPWLHFAAEHVVREVSLILRVPQMFAGYLMPEVPWEEDVLELPVCERAKRIELYLQYAYTTWLRPQAPGLFKALTYLKIGGSSICMEGSDVTTLVSTQCPCLRDLNLAIELIVIFDVFFHSNSLHTLVLRVLETRRLEILAPRLEELTIIYGPKEAHISAPKLVKIDWDYDYDPHVHRFVDVGRRLQLLQTSVLSFSLTKLFDEVDDLKLGICLTSPDVASYESFMNETNKLPKSKSFRVDLSWEHHTLVPIMLRLLRTSNGTKKLRVDLCGPVSRQEMHSCVGFCPCRMEESCKIDGIDLSSLEVVEIRGFEGSSEQIEFVEFLSSNAGVLKRLFINDEFCRKTKKEKVREKVRNMCHPNVKVEFPVLRDERQIVIDEGRLIVLD